MNISICITVLNEEGTIAPLLDSLLTQSKKSDQIIIVDAGSKDETVEIIRHYQRKYGNIKLLIEKCSRARGRNLAVDLADGGIIVMTDAGCIADRNLLKNITSPFATGGVDVVAGFYRMTGNSNLQKAESIYLGIRPSKFDFNFLPSTRSIAFTKKIWEKVGGFPENLQGSAEDTVFNYKLIKAGAKISRVKNAVVEWGMPTSIYNFQLAIFNYAKGDAESKIWFFPGKGLASHNIKALSILFRYLVGLALLSCAVFLHWTLAYWCAFVFICIYLIWAYRKIYMEFQDYRVALWGPILQIVSDVAVISGFISGIL